jgi:DNA-binding LacI/PurR family transcriptional regulator
MTRDAVAFFKGKAKKKPAFLGPCYRESAQAHPARQGYQTAMKTFFPEWGDSLIIDYYVREETREQLRTRLTEKYREHGFDALIIPDANLAEDVLGALAGMQVKIPEELEIVTVRDADLLPNLHPAISAFQVDEIAIGQAAARIFTSDFQPGEDFFHGRLMERASSYNPSGKADQVDNLHR